jgi:UDP-3-O-[3-hydroxymyristoyl] N-acetylglucosamine deacetylase/3-hydroxyacyl-[acyl-carrier-protein] dehydratase
MQVDNAIIEINGPEPPILDGSALEYVKAVKTVGTVQQNANRQFYVIDEPIHYVDPEKNADIAALPHPEFRVTVMVDYNSKVLGIQHATMLRITDFEEEIAPCRTFVFLHELKALKEAGLIKGGSLQNAIVIVENPVSESEMDKLREIFQTPNIEIGGPGFIGNVKLRHSNEAARHKLLDLVGDLSLLGSPLKGQIISARPGHKANVEFARLIKKKIKQRSLIRRYQSTEESGVVFDVNAIAKILPHRYPFLLVDRIVSFEDNKIEGIKNVTFNEQFFQGHFPGNPIMPGVLQLEAMAQVGGILLLQNIESPDDYWVYLLSIENVRFKRPVVPGDQLHFCLVQESFRRGICKMRGQAFVDGKLVTEATMVAALVKKDSK